jgi:hypothetical protein
VRAFLADHARLAAMGAAARRAAPRYARTAEIQKFAAILESTAQQ